MNHTPIFTGSGVAIVTPMNEDLSINYDKLGDLIDMQIENGTDAIIICGTTGESATMSDKEHVDCIKYAVARTNKRVPVIAGAGSNDTAYAIWLSKESEAAGADALLHVTPYYNKCSQKGLLAHFVAIADATPLPIVLYNVPSRTSVNIAPETYLALSKHPRIIATKEASGDLSHIAKIKQLCGDSLAIYSGNDDQIVPIMALGGLGVISVAANIIPQPMHDICHCCLENNFKEATDLQNKYLPLINSLFCEVNPIPVKGAMNLLGMNCGSLRLPLTEMEDSTKELLSIQLKNFQLL